MKRILISALVLLLGAALAPAAEGADIDWGVRAGAAFEGPDPLIGVEALWGLTNRVFFNPNVEVIFRDNDEEDVSVNADVHYDLPTGGNDFIWVGAGLAARETGDDDDFGANLLGGYGWDRKTFVPYAQLKVFIGDESEGSLVVGVRF